MNTDPGNFFRQMRLHAAGFALVGGIARVGTFLEAEMICTRACSPEPPMPRFVAATGP